MMRQFMQSQQQLITTIGQISQNMNSIRVNQNTIGEGINTWNKIPRGASVGGSSRPFQHTFAPREGEESTQPKEEPLVDEVIVMTFSDIPSLQMGNHNFFCFL